MRTTFLLGLATISGLSLYSACSASGGSTLGTSDNSTNPLGSGGSQPAVTIVNPVPSGNVDMTGKAAPAGCGDGILTTDEAFSDVR